ncbi:hypothetical protein XENOCAPTIV_006297 [Xenoophorus captivus]|uniref:Uncharacterized protein n=1 Tax=Xenoophorus captivus TaxID=1517983 RepID=A0ABV0Q8C4_9TELE
MSPTLEQPGSRKMRTWDPAAVTLSAARPPAVWDQRLETWEVFPLQDSHRQGTPFHSKTCIPVRFYLSLFKGKMRCCFLPLPPAA